MTIGPPDRESGCLDLLVDELLAAGARAERLGAVVAPVRQQPFVRVYLDPAGDPF